MQVDGAARRRQTKRATRRRVWPSKPPTPFPSATDARLPLRLTSLGIVSVVRLLRRLSGSDTSRTSLMKLLPPGFRREVLDALAQNGYSTVRDLKDATPEDLATGVSTLGG